MYLIEPKIASRNVYLAYLGYMNLDLLKFSNPRLLVLLGHGLELDNNKKEQHLIA